MKQKYGDRVKSTEVDSIVLLLLPYDFKISQRNQYENTSVQIGTQLVQPTIKFEVLHVG